MRSARSLYRLNAAVAAVGALVLLGGLVAALRAVRLEVPTLDALGEACMGFLLPQFTLGSLAVLLLGSVSVGTLTLGVRSLARQLRDQRRFVAAVREVEPLAIDGAAVTLIEDDGAHAFCAGMLRPRIYLSTGALVALDDDELRAVVAHERHHQQRHDPLRILIVRVLGEALFFLPILRRLRERYTALAELAADEAAVRRIGDRVGLASALLAFGERADSAVVVGVARERVDHLLGGRPRWELPLSLLLGSLVTIGGLAAIAGATASMTVPGAVSLPTLLAGVCALVMSALPAMLGGTLLLLFTRRSRGAR